MIRILHIVTHMNRGGLETMIMNYYRNIDRSLVQFDFLVHRFDQADYDEEIIALGGKIYRLPNLNPFNKKYINCLNEFFKEHKEYKIVHCHLDCMSAIPLEAAKRNNVPVRIAHSHNSNQTKDLKYPLKLYYKNKISKYATHLFACSREAGKWMFNTNQFSVLPNAIDTKLYSFNEDKRNKIRNELQLNNQLVVGHVGRFNSVKNHTFIIDIFNELHKIVPDSYLLLAGTGDLITEIKDKVNKLKLSDNVKFLGLRADIPDLMQSMDVFVFPSLYEGLPVTLIEAQASGLPCIISDKVPIECRKTDLVQQISLEKSAKQWAEVLLKVSKSERRNTYDEIVSSGFDIRSNATKLQEYYINQYKEI